jgi:hypothetical protein
MGHEQFVKKVHICVAKIGEILVLVDIGLLGSNSSKTSFDLDVGSIDARRHDAPDSELISQVKRECGIHECGPVFDGNWRLWGLLVCGVTVCT